MSNLFGNLTNEGLEESQDRLGGYQVTPSDAYEATIKMAYAIKSAGGAHGIVLMADLGGKDYTETVYITNKQGENFFLNKQDKSKKLPLPGFTTIDDICLLASDKPLSQQTTEEKIVKIYDYEQKKEVPTAVPVLTDLVGKKVILGIIAQTVNKNVKNDRTGDYEPTAESRDENVIEKSFHADLKVTVVEAKAGKTSPEFYEAWVAKNKGVTRDRRTIKDGATGQQGQSGKPGAAPVAGGGAAKTNSLFGAKS